MTLEKSRRFWDEKAQENAFWYVSSYGPYAGRDLQEFWASGVRIWGELKAAVGYEPKPADVVVEIGCGVGRLTRAIAPEVGQVHAFDLSAEMLAKARELPLPNATFHHADGKSLAGMPDGSADLVLAYCVFQHLPSEDVLGSYLKEMQRVARRGGLVALTLTPRGWRSALLPVSRMRRWVTEKLDRSGPRGLFDRAWTGIRPSRAAVARLSGVPLQSVVLHGDKWLFWHRRHT
jgi:SAM-dependent methyltransferase